MPANGSCNGQQLGRLAVVQIDHQHRHLHVGRGLGAEVAVDQFQRAVGQFAGQQGVGIADLGQHAAQGVLLGLRMGAPVLRIAAATRRPSPAAIPSCDREFA